MKVLRHLIAMIVLTSLLSACFVNNLIYKHIDWIIQYQIDRYFDLENPQGDVSELRLNFGESLCGRSVLVIV